MLFYLLEIEIFILHRTLVQQMNDLNKRVEECALTLGDFESQKRKVNNFFFKYCIREDTNRKGVFFLVVGPLRV